MKAEISGKNFLPKWSVLLVVLAVVECCQPGQRRVGPRNRHPRRTPRRRAMRLRRHPTRQRRIRVAAPTWGVRVGRATAHKIADRVERREIAPVGRAIILPAVDRVGRTVRDRLGITPIVVGRVVRRLTIAARRARIIIAAAPITMRITAAVRTIMQTAVARTMPGTAAARMVATIAAAQPTPVIEGRAERRGITISQPGVKRLP